MTDASPLYLYKLVPSSLPVREPLPERLPVSDIDQKSGFIHLSTAFQVPNTLNAFFRGELMVYVLRIPYSKVLEDIRWESPEGTVCGPRPKEGLFPVCFFIDNYSEPQVLIEKHLYNGLKLGKDEVESISVWTNQEGWDKALNLCKPWLLY